MSDRYRRLCEQAARHPPDIALVLGSGMDDLADRVQPLATIPFSDVPELAPPSVPGHRGQMILGAWAGRSVLVFAGRLHYYEGHSWSKIVQPVHIARQLGARTLLLTNSVGGIRDDLAPGSLLAAKRHLDWTTPMRRPLPSKESESPYAGDLIYRMQEIAGDMGVALPTCVYAQVTGPCYETPAEVRALKSLGVDAVGMSTAREAEAGFALGMKCVALSCVTNRAAGLGPGTIHHEEVLACTSQAAKSVGDLLEKFIIYQARMRGTPSMRG